MTASAVLIAGAGIAGLTTALALAKQGIESRIFEREARLSETGAGLQLSPNATRLLGGLGLLSPLRDIAVQPRAVIIKDGADLAELARVPLGTLGELRWRAPYLVIHRADLQTVLLEAASRSSRIEIVTDAQVVDARAHDHGITLETVSGDGTRREARGRLAIGADGVWSKLRAAVPGAAAARFSGEIAWRTTLAGDGAMGRALALIASPDCVTTFVHPRFHLVCYPVKAGRAFNLVAVTGGTAGLPGWAQQADQSILEAAMTGVAEPLAILARGTAPWTMWPLYEVAPTSGWSDGRSLVLVGDAAHALTPFAAQGAAMAVEDAVVLADCLAGGHGDRHALARFEALRRPRLKRVAARGRFNRFAWHAAWPVSAARNLVLSRRGPQRLAADMDWLYGYPVNGEW